MNDLNVSFTFRLSEEDKAALGVLAERWGCDRGAALRRFIRQSALHPTLRETGQFTANGHVFALRLRKTEGVE
jgi:predicted transcriptional regulator